MLKRIVWAVCCLLFSNSSFAQDYQVVATPDWVMDVSIPAALASDEQNNEGRAWLLVDRQYLLAQQNSSRFYRYVSKVTSPEGIDDAASITIDFTPGYQQLQLHALNVIRDGQRISQLQLAKIDVMPAANDAQSRVYNQDQQLSVSLHDVQVGDVVEYSFSRVGENPLFAGHFAIWLDLAWRTSVGKVSYRLVNRSQTPLSFRYHRSDAAFDEFDDQSFLLQIDNVAGINPDEDYPNSFQPFPYVQISDFASWQQVVGWMLPRFESRERDPAILKLAQQLFAESMSQEQKALKALNYVQDRIRFVDPDVGLHAQLPLFPSQVLKQGFADVKDKALLLLSLLRSQGIESNLALVHQRLGKALPEFLPAQYGFNHLLVQVALGEQTYWLDPTRQHQQGSLDTLYQPNRHHALPLIEGQRDLVSLPPPAKQQQVKRVIEEIDLTSRSNNMMYKIIATYQGFYADDLRRELAEEGQVALEQDYLGFTQKYYPGISLRAPLRIDYDYKENIVTTTEFYQHDDAWQPVENEPKIAIQFEPFLMDDHLKVPEEDTRTMPLAIEYPLHLSHVTRILLEPGSTMEEQQLAVDDPAFSYTKNVTFSDGVLTIAYDYYSKTDVVNPQDFALYKQNLQNAYDAGYYQISRKTSKIIKTTQPAEPRAPSGDGGELQNEEQVKHNLWYVVVIAGLAGVGIIWLIFRSDPNPVQYTGGMPSSSVTMAINGVILLIALGYTINGISDFSDYFDQQNWTELAQTYSSGFLQLIEAELALMILTLSGLVAVSLLYLQRRHTYVPVFCVLLVADVLLGMVDAALVGIIGRQQVEFTLLDFAYLLLVMLVEVIWVIYLALNQSVKATFNQRSVKNRPVGEQLVRITAVEDHTPLTL